MSIRSSVHSYNKAYDLFQEVRELWDSLEGASDFQYMEALDKIDELQKHATKVDLNEIREYLKQEGKESQLDDIKNNIEVFKEAAYVIGREILGWSYYEDLMDSVPRFITAIKKKWPLRYSGDKSDLVKRFIAAITHRDNVERYKSNIESIIRGNMTLPYFSRIYDALMSDDKKEARKAQKKIVQHPHPPEMYTGTARKEYEETLKKSREEWEEMRGEKEEAVDLSREKPEEFKKRNKNYIKTPEGEELQYDFVTKTSNGVVTYFLDGKEVFRYLGEAFISLFQYKKLFKI